MKLGYLKLLHVAIFIIIATNIKMNLFLKSQKINNKY